MHFSWWKIQNMLDIILDWKFQFLYILQKLSVYGWEIEILIQLQWVWKTNYLILKAKWSTDYILNLNGRNKQLVKKENVKIGSIVLLKVSNLPMCNGQ